MESISEGLRHEVTPSVHELHQNIITVKVGSEEKRFLLHRERLCHYSGYFKRHLERNIKQAETEIPDCGIAIFKLFEEWLYTFQIGLNPDDTDQDAFSLLFQLYQFADVYDTLKLKHACVDSIIHRARRGCLPSYVDVLYLYSNTTRDSRIRALLLDLLANGNFQWLRKNTGMLTPDLIQDIAIHAVNSLEENRSRGELGPWHPDASPYYDHAGKPNGHPSDGDHRCKGGHHSEAPPPKHRAASAPRLCLAEMYFCRYRFSLHIAQAM